MPGVPFLYYGDEIGQRYLSLRTKEGGYFRTGSRTPMQWSREENLGFSKGREQDLYLPVDASQDAPVVSEMLEDPDSLLNTVRSVLKLRREEEDLHGQPNLKILYAESGKLPFVYQRGARICAVNPSSGQVSVRLDAADRNVVWKIGEGTLKDKVLTLQPQSFVVF